jgi:hypothetical protein
LLFGVASWDCPTPVSAPSMVPGESRDAHMTAVKMRSRSSEALLL